MPSIKSLLTLIVSVLIALFIVLFGLQLLTAERVKTRLETLLSERTGLATEITGTVNWRYLWPTAVTLHDINARNESDSEHWLLESLRLEVSTLSILKSPRTPERWNITGFALQQLRGQRQTNKQTDVEPDQLRVRAFWIKNLQPQQAAPFAATLQYQPAKRRPVDLMLDGKLRFIASERRLHFEPAIISGDVAEGECRADIALRAIVETTTTISGANPQADVLNVDLWRRSDWDLHCELAQLRLRGQHFAQVALDSNNFLGTSQSKLVLPEMFGGNAQLALAIDASDPDTPPSWQVATQAENIAGDALDAWLQGADADAPLFQGPLNLNGQILSHGNTRPAMLQAASGKLQLHSDGGTIDLRTLKQRGEQTAKQLGSLIGESELLASWPDELHYQRLEGTWTPNAGLQLLTAQLDNVRLSATAKVRADLYDSHKDELDAQGTLTFASAQAGTTLSVPTILEDLPLPFFCRGQPTEPACELDAKASKKLLSEALKGNGPAGLSKKIDTMIEDKVPEQYRRAARSLLEILGHSIEDDDAEELEDFLDDELDQELDEAPDELPQSKAKAP